MQIVKRIITLALACTAFSSFSFGSLKAQKSVVDRVIWLVGDEPILLSDIEMQKLRLRSEGHKFEGNPDCLIPEQIAVQKLFLNQAKIDSIKADDTQVNRGVEAWENYVISQLGSKEKVEEYFNKPFSKIKEERRKEVRNGNIVQAMQRKITANVQISPSEIRNFYNSLPQDSLPYVPQTIEVQLITQEPKVDLAEVDRIKSRLRSFVTDINDGKRDFATLARLYSEDKRTAIRGGEYGFVGKTSLEDAFADVVFGLNDNKRVSQIVKTEEGYHIVQLIEKRGDMVNFRHILMRPEANEKALVLATERLDTLAQAIKDKKISFDEAAKRYSEDKDTRNSGGLMTNKNQESKFYSSASFRYEDLPQDISKQAYDLKEEEISKPFIYKQRNGKEFVALVRLKAIHPEHLANLNSDYRTIKELALTRKRETEINRWIRRKQKETPIVIRVRYSDCDFRYPGWVQKNK